MDDKSPQTDLESGAVDDRVMDLCQRGLEAYRAGDVANALLDWNQARALDDAAEMPRLYIERAAHGLDPESGEVPSGLKPLGGDFDDDDDDGYAEVEVTRGGDDMATRPLLEQAKANEFVEAAHDVFALDDLDAGWSLDDTGGGDALPAPPASAVTEELSEAVQGLPDGAIREPDAEAEPDVDALPAAPVTHEAGELLELAPPGGEFADQPTADIRRPAELELELELGAAGASAADDEDEITVPGGVEEELSGGLSLSQDALAAISETAEQPPADDTTVERPGVVTRGLALPDLEPLDDARTDDRHEGAGMGIAFRASTEDELTIERRAMEAGDDELTVERGAVRALELDADELTVERRSAGLGPSPVVEVAPELDVLLAENADNWDDALAVMREETLATMPENLEGDERVRRVLTAFIDRASVEMDRGKPDLAVTALELALGEQPESVVAQKLIHRHRELLLGIYRAYLGDMSLVPKLAMAMSELPAQSMDNRSVFLLSRIDGTFTLEEVVDVSGMTPLEAYRHLSKLILKGILKLH